MSQLVAQSGLPLSLILFPFFGILTTYTLIVLYNLARFHHKTSLPELCRLAFGEIGYYITCLLIFIFNFGGVLGMFLMFAQVGHHL
jgi:sodium-coupled neutral amino acid transporter 11